MTPPVPPKGYELVDDEPRKRDKARVCCAWTVVNWDLLVFIDDFPDVAFIQARDLRWIARKK